MARRSLTAAPGAALRNYLANALAPSTRLAYEGDIRHFQNWGGQIPATPSMVAKYLAAFATRMKASTLTRRVAAIGNAHAALARSSPTHSDMVRSTLRGIRRVHGGKQKQAKPLELSMLRAATRRRTDLSESRDVRDRALLLLGFAGGFRRSELVRLRPADLVFTPSGVAVTIQRSKTDPHAMGRAVAIPAGKGQLCPVRALKAWLVVLHRADPEGMARPLFRRIGRYGHVGAGLRSAAVGSVLRERLRHCGLSCDGYSAHSLRAGLVTAAARAGVPTWAIQRQTGHRSESTVHRYIRDLSPFEANAYGQAVSAAA